MEKKILVMEKDENVLDIIIMLLKEEGYTAKGLTSEKDFFDEIDKFKPNAILLDVVTPSDIGLKLCEDIKQHPKHGSIPIIVLSTHYKAERAKEVCASEVVNKPFDIDELIETVNKQLVA
ncbi:MAG: response regulator [Pedobacter sp.]|nr:MAG: response regulator [Pedobacter sp.]